MHQAARNPTLTSDPYMHQSVRNMESPRQGDSQLNLPRQGGTFLRMPIPNGSYTIHGHHSPMTPSTTD